MSTEQCESQVKNTEYESSDYRSVTVHLKDGKTCFFPRIQAMYYRDVQTDAPVASGTLELVVVERLVQFQNTQCIEYKYSVFPAWNVLFYEISEMFFEVKGDTL